MFPMTQAHCRKVARRAAHLIGLAVACAAICPAAAPAADIHPDSLPIGPTAASRRITIALALPSRDPEGAAAFVAHVTRRGDPLFRQYLSPAEYAARFGAETADYAAVVAWVRGAGLTPGEAYAGRTVLPVTGTVAALESAFGVTFKDHRKVSGETFYAVDEAPKLPAEIIGKVSGVIGFSNDGHFRPLLRKVPAGSRPAGSGSGPGGAYSAADLRAAYSIGPQYFGPKTQTLAVFEQGGFDPADLAVYRRTMQIAPIPVTVRAVDGYSGAIDDPNVELESVLDIDMQMATNPEAAKIIVYEDGADSFQVALLDSLSAMASDGKAKTISISYGQDEAEQGSAAIKAENTVLTQLAAQGQAVFVSAGDSGAYGDEAPALNVSDPASQPLVTAVGGTTLFTGPGARYEAETTWNDLGLGFGATGGGISTVWKIPAYQVSFGTSVAATNGGSSTFRNVPDVAVVGDPLTGVAVYSKLNGGWITVGGTSVGAPIWAGFYSTVNADSEGLGLGSLGFANPTIYGLANGLQYSYPDFNDVLDGSNGDPTKTGVAGFYAGNFFDNTTGWGSFNGDNLALDVTLYPINPGTKPPALPTDVKATSATKTSITLTWKAGKGDIGFLAYAEDPATTAGPKPVLVVSDTATITGLAPSTYYKLWVVPVSKGGANRQTRFIYYSTK
jgi:kumamolisin